MGDFNLRTLLFKHYKLCVIAFHTLAVLIFFGGLTIAAIESPGDELSGLSLGIIFCSAIISVGLEIIMTASPLKHVSRRMMRLWELSHGRRCYRPDHLPKNRAQLIDDIQARLNKKRMRPVADAADAGFVGCFRGTLLDTQKHDYITRYNSNYYLYSLDYFDTGAWEQIKLDLQARLGRDRAEQRNKNKKYGIVNSICILADAVDPEAATLARAGTVIKISDTITLRGNRICVGDVTGGRYYYSAERTHDQNKSVHSLSVLCSVTFGKGIVAMNKYGDDYTEEYTRLLEESLSVPLSELISNGKRSEEDVDQTSEEHTHLSEGEVLREGDSVRIMLEGVETTVWLMKPEDVEDLLSDEDEDVGDYEDLIPNLEEMADSDDDEPSLEDDYRGPVVIDISDYGTKGKKLVKLNGNRKKEYISKAKEYLASEGFDDIKLFDDVD